MNKRIPWFSLLLFALGLLAGVARAQVHDFENLPEARSLANPKVVTATFPKRVDGRPDWVQALELGLISPRSTRTGEPRPPEPAEVPMPSEGIVFANTKFMPNVVFPHRQHAEWLSCLNCHEKLFELRATGRGQGMLAIFEGRHCGTCHGRVAFAPEGSCYRCHSKPNPIAMKEGSPFVEPVDIEVPEVLQPEVKKRRGSKADAAIYRGRLVPSIIPPPVAPPLEPAEKPVLE